MQILAGNFSILSFELSLEAVNELKITQAGIEFRGKEEREIKKRWGTCPTLIMTDMRCRYNGRKEISY